MPWGNTDYTGLNRLSNAMSGFSEGEAHAAEAIGQLRERANSRRRASSVLSYFQQQDLTKPENVTKTAQTIGGMLVPGDPSDEKVANYVHGALQLATQNMPSEPKAPTPQWVDRGSTTVYDVPKPGDYPYAKAKEPTPETPQWLNRSGKPAYDVPKPGDSPWYKPEPRGEGILSRQEQIAKEKLEKTEQDLLGQVQTQAPNLNLKGILQGTEPMPIQPGTEKYVYTMEKDKDGNLIQDPETNQPLRRPVGGKPNMLVAKWHGAVKAKQDFYRTHKIPFEDAMAKPSAAPSEFKWPE